MLPQEIGGNCNPELDDGAEGAAAHESSARMQMKLRPDGPAFDSMRLNTLGPPFRVPGQFESIGQQGLHHQARLVFRGIPLRAPLNVEPIVVDPGRQTGQVVLTKLECELG